jgi:CO dehydrogenase maturation factor
MKIAVSGKGGVGKTTFSAMLARTLAERGFKVLAVDADPDANLGQALGFPDYQKLVPVSDMKDLINERTEAKDEGMGTFFKLNPTVHLVLLGKDVIILDMEAGLEHLGRGTSRGVDFLIVVVEPGRRSVDTAAHIRELAGDIGLTRVLIVGNKIRSPQDKDYLLKALEGFNFLGFIEYDDDIIKADMQAVCPTHTAEKAKIAVVQMTQKLVEMATSGPVPGLP